MGKAEKLLDRFVKIPKDLTWDELTSVLAGFGYFLLKNGKTGGSRRKFVNKSNSIIILHKPHPGNIVKQYALKQVIDHLREKGSLQ